MFELANVLNSEINVQGIENKGEDFHHEDTIIKFNPVGELERDEDDVVDRDK